MAQLLFTIMYKTAAQSADSTLSLKERIPPKISALINKSTSAQLITSLKSMGLRMRVNEAQLQQLHQELTQHNLSYKLNSLESEIPLLIESMNMTLETMNILFKDLEQAAPDLTELKTNLHFYFNEMIAQRFLYLVSATCCLKSDESDTVVEKLKKIFSMDNCFEVFTKTRNELMSDFQKIQENDQLITEMNKLITRVNELIPPKNDNQLKPGR